MGDFEVNGRFTIVSAVLACYQRFCKNIGASYELSVVLQEYQHFSQVISSPIRVSALLTGYQRFRKSISTSHGLLAVPQEYQCFSQIISGSAKISALQLLKLPKHTKKAASRRNRPNAAFSCQPLFGSRELTAAVGCLVPRLFPPFQSRVSPCYRRHAI